MASAELKELVELAKEAGLEGTELSNFLRDERTRLREREKEEREREEEEREREEKEREREEKEREREEKERERQREREKEEGELRREREKAEAEALQRDADRHHEIELARLRLEDSVLNHSGQAERNNGSMGSIPKLPSFDEKSDDLDAYLYRFEGYATMQGWPKERWASNLSALLKGNALQVFHRMSLDDSGEYELLKIALLNRYRLTDADFRNKFRQAKPQDGESFSQFGIRITGYLDRWIELSETSLSYEGIRDLLIREQALGVGSAELRVFIEERTPGSFKEMCSIAEQYLKAHGKSFRHWWMSDKHRSEGHETKGLNSENKSRFSNATSKFHGRSGQARESSQSKPTAGRACWICSSVKHYARECPQNIGDRPGQSSRSKVGGNATTLACEEALLFKGGLKLTTKQDGDLRYIEDKSGKKYQVKEIVALASEQNKGMITALGRVSGRPDTIEVLRDSGCSTMVIREDLCDPRDFTGETRGCVMMDGRVVEVPVVKKRVDTPYYIGEVEGVAMKAPIYDLVIGNVHGARGQEDPDTSWEIPTGEEITEHETSVEPQDVGPAITSHEKTGGVVTRLQSKDKPLRPLKVAKTKIVELTSTEFKKLQETDKSLDKLRKKIESKSVEKPKQWGTEVYYIDQKNGLMYRHFTSPPEKGSVVHKQLILPHSLRESVLEVAHDSILGGHLATKKTYDRVTSNFFWPGVSNDVSRYCQSCDICQRTIPKGRCGKAPLVAMPIIGEPFARVAIDLVGPLPMSGRKHRWILTLVDCATRYPEAIPMKGIDTIECAEELVNIFSRIGIPQEILSDRGSQFVSDLMREISRLLSVRQLQTTPYHAQCNGLVERWNGTLRRMLQKMAAERPSDWDRYIPALLFSYREVAQASLGFSPFELVYGRSVRGPMSVLRDIWADEDINEQTKTTYQYVLELRERLESTCKLAHDELRKAQENQHKWFNKKARAKHLKEGDQVLLLLPTKLNKLEMQWQGPFDIIKKVRENDYVINLDGQHKMFHANMLRKYLVRKTIDKGMVILCGCRHLEIATGGMAENDSLEEPDTCEERSDDIKYCPLRATQTWEDVKISADLSEDQQREVRQLLEEYSDVLTDIPGKTNLAECNIELTDDIPFRVKAYPVPYALKKEMDKEVTEMMKADIIESSVSEYASSPVVVRKPDGSVRYCIDFRKLNAKTVFDAEPVPNQEVILNRMGGDNFISRLDLTKGFWQVPIKEEDRKYTAFSTDQGLMQFKYMPFGLVNALAIFCRMVRKLLYDVNYVDAYVDDIVPHTATWDDHMHTLRQVLQKLRQHGLTAKPSKCEIGHAKLDLLGHVVGGGSIQPQDRKIEKIMEMRKPETKKELKSFLGTIGFYQRYIDKYAEKGKALTNMLKKGEPNQIKWDAESDESFQTLKTALTQKPILRLPNFEKQFVLQTDASDSGLGAVLLQEYDGVNMPVMYISRKLNGAETRYSTIERECLALFWATKRLHVYLYGTEFILEIDHQPLAFVNRANIDNDRVMRWALHLQMYRYQVRIVKGSVNTTADLLSRCGL